MSQIPPEMLELILSSPAVHSAPPGVTVSMVDPNHLRASTNAYVAGIFTIVISSLVVLMRIYTKAFVVRKLSITDYTIIASYACWLVYFPIAWQVMVNGASHHLWNIFVRTLVDNLYWTYLSSIFYSITIALVKTAVLLQYIEVFAGTRRGFVFWASHITIWVNNCFYIAIILAIGFSCKPRERYWKQYLPGTCLNMWAEVTAAAVINTFTDILIILIPQKAIWQLQLPLRNKIGISTVFAAGLLACIASIVRMQYSIRVMQTRDITFYNAHVGIWTWVEICVGLSCVSVASLPMFIRSLNINSPFLTRAWQSLTGGSKPSQAYHVKDKALRLGRIPSNGDDRARLYESNMAGIEAGHGGGNHDGHDSGIRRTVHIDTEIRRGR